MFGQIITLLMQFAPFINIFFAAVVIFSERRNPAVTWAWLMVVLLIPYIGFILYLLVGIEGRKYRTFASKARQNQQMLQEVENKDFDGLAFARNPAREENMAAFKKMLSSRHIADLLHLNFASGGGYLTQNDDVELLLDGDTKFSRLLEDIKNAKSFIHIQYYIFRGDATGRKIVAALAEKARQGVEVKLLIDGCGNFPIAYRNFKSLIAAGGQLGVFLPPRFFRMNFQNHRKICVIDGDVGYIGGFNVGDEYMGHVKRFGTWRDMHIRIRGDAAKEMGLHFIMDWNFAVPKQKIEMDEKYFPLVPKTDYAKNGHLIQIVSSGPDTKWPNVYNGISKMINEANETIYIQTPYFVPDENIFESLKIAALSGIDVRIVIPGNPDHFFVKWCSMSYLGDLLQAGVKCYEYTEGFIHSKLIIIDDFATSIGTTNMDIRSFKLNFEINAFIYDQHLTRQFKEQFNYDLADSREITIEEYENRSMTQKAKEAFSRLLSPLL
ncbi:MAG: cardiolipin synthase [Defluviitaleaceae bacterium]|nr:cardiolipin synthase [Defluviitaleaceae bacterium]